MATFTLQQLLAGVTEAEALVELTDLLSDIDIDTTDWKEGDPSQTFLQLQSLVYSKLSQKIASSLSASLNEFSFGEGLSALGDSYFDNQRLQSSRTEGDIIVSGSATLFPLTFNATELQVTDGTFVFENINQVVLNQSQPFVTASFRALEAGSDYNIGTSSSLSTVDSFVGMSVRNPIVPTTTTWITTTGTDEEEDKTLRLRNKNKWANLQAAETTKARVTSLALSASSNVAFVNVDDTNPRGAFTVDVYISALTTTGSAEDAAAVQAKLDALYFGNTAVSSSTYHRMSASLATEIEFSSSINVIYNPTTNFSELQTDTFAAATAWVGEIPIGGNNYAPFANLSNIASINDLVVKIESVPGVSKIVVAPNTDLTFLKNEKLTSPSDWGTVITFSKLSVGI